jgi:CubicO group peptidase (beta-lactamase class C family)
MRRLMLVLFSPCLGVLLTAPSRAWSQPGQANGPLVAAIDKLVKKKGFTANGPGVAILVQRGDGQILFKKGYGLANLESEAAITAHTMFELASVSKTFTATAVLILHDRSQLSIHDDVRKYLPELPEYHKGQPIRLTNLLHHTSGLPDYMDFDDFPARNKDYWVNEDYVGQFARQRDKYPATFRPGAKYEYNNTNYMLLALLVERVAKQSFGTFLRKEIFGPAGMKHAFVFESPTSIPQRPAAGCINAIGYTKKKKRWQPSWGVPPDRQETMLTVGDGSVWCNLEDMAHWDLALRSGKLLEPATMKLALTPSRTRDGKTNTYGLGWDLYFDDDTGTMNGYGHEGSWGGFRTSYYRYLRGDRTTILLSNRGDFDADEFWYPLNGLIEEHADR